MMTNLPVGLIFATVTISSPATVLPLTRYFHSSVTASFWRSIISPVSKLRSTSKILKSSSLISSSACKVMTYCRRRIFSRICFKMRSNTVCSQSQEHSDGIIADRARFGGLTAPSSAARGAQQGSSRLEREVGRARCFERACQGRDPRPGTPALRKFTALPA